MGVIFSFPKLWEKPNTSNGNFFMARKKPFRDEDVSFQSPPFREPVSLMPRRHISGEALYYLKAAFISNNCFQYFVTCSSLT